MSHLLVCFTMNSLPSPGQQDVKEGGECFKGLEGTLLWTVLPDQWLECRPKVWSWSSHLGPQGGSHTLKRVKKQNRRNLVFRDPPYQPWVASIYIREKYFKIFFKPVLFRVVSLKQNNVTLTPAVKLFWKLVEFLGKKWTDFISWI